MVVTLILSLGASEQEGSITSGSKMYGMGTVHDIICIILCTGETMHSLIIS